jgi:uncharacterized SAM-binding protein YcdF (DUF218 family)
MSGDTGPDLTDSRLAEVTAFVDIEAPPPPGQPTAVIIFGTNQTEPAVIAAERYRQGLAPLIIVTGGVNRHNQVTEAREFHRVLTGHGVPDDVIRIEDRSLNTWQNVEFALPFLREALSLGLSLTAICKWYHRRAVHMLKAQAPQAAPFHVITWEPVYDGQLVTRTAWPAIPDGRRRVIREWEEVSRRVADGTLAPVARMDGAWT